MKTKEELNALKEEVETLSKKLHELTEDELAQVSGGDWMRPNGGIPIVHSSSNRIGVSPVLNSGVPTSPETPGINGAPSLKPNEFGPTYYK